VLAVVCVSQGNYQGRGAEYVNRLYHGVKRHLSIPHCFLCFTDNPTGLHPDIWPYHLPTDLAGWWCKLYLFAASLRPGTKIIFLDLDTIIAGSLDEIAGYEGQFAILRDFYRPDGYGSGVMLWRQGFGRHIWDQWNAAGRPKVDGGDQAWIEKTQPTADRLQDLFPGQLVSFKEHCREGIPAGANVVCFHGRPKPHEQPAAWIENYWR
jgi:hypothetical protein